MGAGSRISGSSFQRIGRKVGETARRLAEQRLGQSTTPGEAQAKGGGSERAPTMNRNPEGTRVSEADRQLAQARLANNPTAAQLQQRVQGSDASAQTPGANLSSTPVDIRAGGQQARRDLIAGVPQTNDVSRMAGNAQTNCGGAAVANSLILTDRNGENARALRSAAQQQNVSLSSEEQTALRNFENGRLSQQDVAHLHQIAYRTGSAWDGAPQPQSRVTAAGIETAVRQREGVNLTAGEQRAVNTLRDIERRTARGEPAGQFPPDQVADLQSAAAAAGYPPDAQIGGAHQIRPNGVANLAAALRRNGGFAHADGPVRFHQFRARGENGANDYSHWTTSVGDTHVNSMPGSNGRARVSTSGVPQDAQRTGERWQAEVAVERTPGGTHVINMDTAIEGNTSEVNRSQLRPEHDYRPRRGYLDRRVARDPAEQQRARQQIEQLVQGPSDAWDADNRTVEALRNNPDLLKYATAEERAWMRRAVGSDDIWHGDGEQSAQQQIFQRDQEVARDETPSLVD